MKKSAPPKLFLAVAAMTIISFAFSACTNPQAQNSSVLTVPGKQKKTATPEEKKALQDQLQKAADSKDYAAFGGLLAQVYANGWEGEDDFRKIESGLYVKGTELFVAGKLDEAAKMADTIYAKVYESWRFKYLRIRCLQKYGQNAFDKGDLATAQKYAMQIMSIEFRPEGVNLMAKIFIKQAQDAIKNGDKALAKKILMQSNEMEIDPALRKQIDDMMKNL